MRVLAGCGLWLSLSLSQAACPPVLAAGTVGDEWLRKDGHLLPSGKAGALVSWELQLHSRVKQGEVASNNQSVRGTCGEVGTGAPWVGQ